MRTVYCTHCNGTGQIRDERALGKTMQERRKEARKRLREVAVLMGISVGYLSDLEHGRKKWTDKLLSGYNQAIAC